MRLLLAGRIGDRGGPPRDGDPVSGGVVCNEGMDGVKVMRLPRRAPDPDVAAWARSLAALYEAGVPILRALEVATRASPSPSLGQATRELQTRVRAGASLWEAMAHTGVFPEVLTRLVRAGEASGTLGSSLRRAADALEARYRLRSRTTTALLYPMLVLVALGGAAAITVFVAVPAISSIYGAVGMPLPLPTRLLLSVGKAARPIILITTVAATAAAVLVGLKGRVGLVEKIVHRIPWVGRIVKWAQAAEAWRVFAAAYDAGIPVTGSLELAAHGTSSASVRAALLRTRDTVLRGTPLGRAVERDESLWGPILTTCVAVGDESGRLGELVTSACDHMEHEARVLADRLSSLVEPALLICAGGLALIVALGLYMPIFNLASIIAR